MPVWPNGQFSDGGSFSKVCLRRWLKKVVATKYGWGYEGYENCPGQPGL
jgi:hypothetical protein